MASLHHLVPSKAAWPKLASLVIRPCQFQVNRRSVGRWRATVLSTGRVQSRHAASKAADTESNEPTTLGDDVAFSSHFAPAADEAAVSAFNPAERARARRKQLPPSRYRFRSPKYYRGPLHPHQPPPPSSPVSRLFQPGPFSLPRLSQYYTSTLAHDLMVLSYTHTVPGTPPPPPPQRLRGWDDSSPYHKNRPLRGPRGTASSRLPLLRKDIDFTNVPKLERVTVAMLVPSAHKEQGKLPVAGFVLQNVTGQRATVHLAKRGTVPAREGNLRQRYEQKKGRPIAVSANLTGEMMWHFMGTLTGVVLPRIKEWKGMKGSSGDRSGNFMLSLTSDVVGTWPEIAINYDSYPPHLIPGMSIVFHTSASSGKDGRILLSALGLPFQSGGIGK